MNVLDHRAGINFGQGFAWVARRGVPGRDNAQDFPLHTRSYHEAPVLDSMQKEKDRMGSRRVPIAFWLAAACLATSAIVLGEDPAEITPRAKPTEQQAPAPRANIRIDTNLV